MPRHLADDMFDPERHAGMIRVDGEIGGMDGAGEEKIPKPTNGNGDGDGSDA